MNSGLVNIVEKAVKMQISCFPNRPIYLVGETLGACLALSLASRNPDIDFILILGNPGQSESSIDDIYVRKSCC